MIKLKTPKSKVLISDIETNGLYETVDKFHVAWVFDRVMQCYTEFRDVKDYCKYLMEQVNEHGYSVAFHNGLTYDYPVLQKLCPGFVLPRHKIIDTMVWARLIYSNIDKIDIVLLKRGQIPGKLFGSHSLEAYGFRMKVYKGSPKDWAGPGEVDATVWEKFTPEMSEYCRQDVVVTNALYDKLLGYNYPIKAIELEHDIAWYCGVMQRNGFYFDAKKAGELYGKLALKRSELVSKLSETFGSWYKPKKEMTPKSNNKRYHYVAGAPLTIIEKVEFNPGSRAHIAKVLMDRGWIPQEFTDTNQPKVDETVLKDIKDIPEVPLILEYLVVEKRIGQLAEGKNAWLKLEKNGIIHGRVIAQVPAVGAPYGEECRELFGPPSGWLQVGVDASGLELRCLANRMHPFDEGEYATEILSGDIHTKNQMAAGLPTRNNAKTFIYGFLYGAGDAKIGTIVNGTAADGKRLKESFLSATPAIASLRDGIHEFLISEEKWRGGECKVKWRKKRHPDVETLDATRCLIGLDGRLLHIRSPHSALNTQLQSDGALICKKWVCLTTEALEREHRLKHGVDGDFVLMGWIHDEMQFGAKTQEIAELILKVAQECMRRTQEFFNVECQLDTEGKIGANWKECH
jgi:DNA polymerase I-like protein with 3'-5' exonuclease and polymerase domains